MINAKLGTTALIVVVTSAVVLFLQSRGGFDSAPDTIPARTRGPEGAPVQLVEFIDFECTQCAEGSAMIHEFVTRHPDQVRVGVYYFPIPSHQHGMTAAIAADCAAQQGLFWPMRDRLLREQSSWAKSDDVEASLDDIAREIGLDPQKMSSCLQSKQTRQRIERERQWGRENGVRMTPSYVINGETVVGPQMLKRVLERLERELARARGGG